MEEVNTSNKTHVLVLPFPIQGHVNPMLQFSKRLASKGLKVTILTTTSTPIMSMQNQESSTLNNIEFESIFDGYQQGEKPSSPDEHCQRFEAEVPRSVAGLIRKYSATKFPVKCLVYDSILPWVLEVARGFGIQGASFFTQSAAVGSVYWHVMKGEIRVCLENDMEKYSLPSMPELELKDLPSFAFGAGPYGTIYDMVFGQFSNVHEADWVLCNTFNELEVEVLKWMETKWPIKPIGPTIPSMYMDKRLEDDKDYGLSLFKPNSDTCMKWLDSKQPNSVIYVSFGSLAALGEDQMAQLAWGLKQTMCSFLWVVRETEENKLPNNFTQEIITSERGLIVRWSPQLEVLAHKSIGCFVTHCGWNSTLEALSLGVPMVAMPQWTDQPTNAKYVSDVWEVGVRVKVDENGIVTKGEIEKCIKEVMEGERGKVLRRNSEKWKELAKEAVGEGGSSDMNIQEFVTSLECNSTINGATKISSTNDNNIVA